MQALTYFTLVLSLVLTGCATTNQTQKQGFSDKQINEFSNLVEQAIIFNAKDLRTTANDFLNSLDKEKKLTDIQKTYVISAFSDKSYHDFINKRVRTYLTLYPNRYQHDLTLLKSPALTYFKTLYKKTFSTEQDSSAKIFTHAKQQSQLIADLYAITKEPMNNPLRQLLYIYNFYDVPSYQQQLRDFTGSYMPYVMLSCNVELDK